MFRWILTASLLLASASLLSAAGELSNRRAPGFALPDANMKYHDLADFRGKVVIVNIMRTACPHCTTFSKVLQRAQDRYGSRLQVLSIVNPPENQAAVKKYLADNGLSTTILFDCGQMAASYLKLGPQNPSFDVPHFFVIDSSGMIREDYGYHMLSKRIFEGDGLFEVIDKYVQKPETAD